MAIPTDLTGSKAGPVTHDVDARWLMAYAAAVGDASPRYFDTTDPAGIVGHPLFPVCVEWPAVVEARAAYDSHGVPFDEVLAGVHATHDLTIHRPTRPGDRLSTELEFVGVTGIRPGAMTTVRLQTTDARGRPVATTTQQTIHLGVATEGADRVDPDPPPKLVTERHGQPTETTVAVRHGQAHLYTEAARIWNPIHTDRSVARLAGLPDLILHGTANLAFGLSAVIAGPGRGRPESVRRVQAAFRAMVTMPSTLTVQIWPDQPGPEPGRRVVPFAVLNDDGLPAVDRAMVVLGDPPEPETEPGGSTS